jgi:Ras GTPase-activating protein-binding protein 2
VDAQSSANGGIIIQVIGEMSNRGEPWRKFAQTFFLAEQPNGYFVLNDIFRFLKEESVDAEDEDQAHEQTEEAVATQVSTDIVQENVQEPPAPIGKASHPIAAAVPDHLQPSHGPTVKSATPEMSTPEPAPLALEEKKPAPNGIHHSPSAAEAEPAPPAPQVEVVKPSAEPIVPPTPPVETPQPIAPSPPPPPPAVSPTPVPPPPPTTAAVSAPAPASTPVAKPASSSAPAPSPKPSAPAAPPAPKTWANLAAANSNRWGPQVAQEARGVSAAPPPAPISAQKPEVHRAGAPDKEREGGRELHPMHQAALSVATPQCFVKVRSKLQAERLRLTFVTLSNRVSQKSFRTRRCLAPLQRASGLLRNLKSYGQRHVHSLNSVPLMLRGVPLSPVSL